MSNSLLITIVICFTILCVCIIDRDKKNKEDK